MFKNLIGSPEKETLWIPPLIFNNSETNTMLTMHREQGDPIANILIERQGTPQVAPPTVLDETLFYKGSENFVVYRTEYNLLLNCIYDFSLYPFDTQTCTIEVKHYMAKIYRIKSKISIYYTIHCNTFKLIITKS